MVSGDYNPSYSRGWGRRIIWTQEAEVAASQDSAIALHPGWKEQNLASEKKKKYSQVILKDEVVNILPKNQE